MHHSMPCASNDVFFKGCPHRLHFPCSSSGNGATWRGSLGSWDGKKRGPRLCGLQNQLWRQTKAAVPHAAQVAKAGWQASGIVGLKVCFCEADLVVGWRKPPRLGLNTVHRISSPLCTWAEKRPATERCRCRLDQHAPTSNILATQYTQDYKLALSKLCELRVQVLQHWLTAKQVCPSLRPTLSH